MSVSMQMVRDFLESEEPRYAEASRLGPEAIPHLEVLVRGSDPLLASKAAYLASLIKSDRSAEIVRIAANSDEPTVRVAAAAAAQNIATQAGTDLLAALSTDDDQGVRKAAQSLMPDAHLTARPAERPRRGKAAGAARRQGTEAIAAATPAPGEGEGGGESGSGPEAGIESLGPEAGSSGEGGGDLGRGADPGAASQASQQAETAGGEGEGGGATAGGDALSPTMAAPFESDLLGPAWTPEPGFAPPGEGGGHY